MTTRPSLGGSQRQPQRSLSANIVQRPTPNRTLSQQFSPSSPVRRTTGESFGDLPFEDDAALGRYGTLPQNGGSRLKLEISGDSRSPHLIESPKLSGNATPTSAWRLAPPPRGRPQLHFDVPSGSHLSPRVAEGGNAEAAIKPMPLPVRPVQHTRSVIEKARPVSVAKKDARPKPYVLDAPSIAPHYMRPGDDREKDEKSGVVDFFPWTGKHPEDQYTETAIRHGYYDKSQMSQNETGAGKTAISKGIKDRGSNLSVLSTLFTTILEQRRSHGQIKTSSTFKPPPRVTVVDYKRELWLKDLANPTISLRRLSRSIPHGIRGKVLLDQSLSKSIPIDRAVWLAKCVGANELRAFRRKGAGGTIVMGGEAKWIRDFTVCVEQFVESIVNSIGEKDFKGKINYAVRLATHFHAEHLLDREHYMEWLVISLENSPQVKLPIWLLVTQIYWKDLLRHRKYGRRLSTALMNHLAETYTSPDSDILAPLSDRLKSLVKGILVSKPESFVSPKNWLKQKDTLESILAEEDQRYSAVIESIERRNQQLSATNTRNGSSTRRTLIGLLDSTLSRPFPKGLAKRCWSLGEDKGILVQTILDWATSYHRPGIAKIYVGIRILRQWTRYGVDITHSILEFLDSKACEIGFLEQEETGDEAIRKTWRDKYLLYHLISELARSDHFSVATYLQWLVSRGGLYTIQDVDKDGPCATRLLVELPTHNLNESVRILRMTLLRRVGYMVDDEGENIKEVEMSLSEALPGMPGNTDFHPKTKDYSAKYYVYEDSYHSSRSIKSEIGLWLRQKVKIQMQQPTIPPLDDWDDSPVRGGTSAITISDFNTIRQYLENSEDYSMLADILKIVTCSNEPEILASCADTLNLHIDIFSAIGALDDLFDTLVGRLRALSEDASFPRVLLASMSDLAARIPEQANVAQQLALELNRSDRTAVDACSPVSDHMAGVIQNAEVDFVDEVEKILASGNSMDQATLERLFQRIISHLEACWSKSFEQYRSCAFLLTRLRTFSTQQYDILMTSWVSNYLQKDDRPFMMDVLGPLISWGCLALKDVATICASASGDTISAKLRSNEMLQLLIVSQQNQSNAMTLEETYRLRIKQSQLQVEQPTEVLRILQRAFEEPVHFDAVSEENEFRNLVQRLVITETDLTTKTLIMPCLQATAPGSPQSQNVSTLVDKLLTADFSLTRPIRISVQKVLSLADDFTLPFCLLKLSSMLSTTESNSANSEGGVSSHVQAFDRAIEMAVATGNTTWTCIVPLLDISIAQHLRSRAETQFLSLFPSPKTTDGIINMPERVKQAENLLYIIEATAYSILMPPPNSTLSSEMVTTFNNTWQLISIVNIHNTELKEVMLHKWLPLLLSFATIHSSAFELNKAGNESRARTLLALAAIILELQALEPMAPVISAMIERAFDLGLQLVDLLPDDMRQQCIRGLRDTTSDPRIAYLFSIAPNPSGWLVLSQKEKAMGANGQVEEKEKLTQFPLKRWEMLGDPTPVIGVNDTSISLTLFGAGRG